MRFLENEADNNQLMLIVKSIKRGEGDNFTTFSTISYLFINHE